MQDTTVTHGTLCLIQAQAEEAAQKPTCTLSYWPLLRHSRTDDSSDAVLLSTILKEFCHVVLNRQKRKEQ
jgi:hypothetical protein